MKLLINLKKIQKLYNIVLKVIIFIFQNLEKVSVYAVPARSITIKHWLTSIKIF